MSAPPAFSYPSLDRVIDAASRASRRINMRSATDLMISCPGPTHRSDDRNPSLHVTWEQGKTLLNCFAGCHADDVLAALGLVAPDLFDEPFTAGEERLAARSRRTSTPTKRPAPRPRSALIAGAADRLGHPTGRWHVVAEWVYVDDNGRPYGKEVKKTRTHELGIAKTFLQYHYDPSHPKARQGWAPGAPQHPVLYRQPEVRSAITKRELIVVAEGPKDADRWCAAGVCGTSTSGGAANWQSAYTEVLTGAVDLWLVVDHDAAGYKRGLEVPNKLAGHVENVTVMLPLPDHHTADTTDHFDAGHGIDDFIPASSFDLFTRLAAVAPYEAACWLARYLGNDGNVSHVIAGDPSDMLKNLAEAETPTGVPVRDSVRDVLLAAVSMAAGPESPEPAAGDIVPDARDDADDPLANLRPVPGSQAWYYLPGHGVWQFRRGELQRVLTWCPDVTRHLVAHSPRGEVTSRRVTIAVGDVTATAPTQDVADGKVWVDRFPAAPGVASREVRDVLRNIVDDQAAGLPLTSVRPRWVDGHLALPPSDALPAGYTETAGTPEDFAALVRACAKAPRIALVMGLTVGGLYVQPLRRQSYVVHLAGEGRSGKSTALRAAAAIVGFPGKDDGENVVRAWSASPKAVPAALRELAVLPAFRDELGAANLRPEELSALMFTITQGAIRDLATRNSGLRQTEGGWKGALISTGNLTIAGRLTNVDGLGSRIVEFDGAMTLSGAQADEIEELTFAGYGHGLSAIMARGMTPPDFGLWADKAAIDLGIAAGGPQRTLGLHLSLGLAGARLLGEISGVSEFASAALAAAHQLLAELLNDLRERGAKPGDRLLTAIADAMATHPLLFPTRDEYSTTATAGQPPYVMGWDIADESTVQGEVAIVGKELKEIARRAEIEDLNIAIKDLKRRQLLHPQDDGRNNARVLPFPGRRRSVRAYHFSGIAVVERPPATESAQEGQDHPGTPAYDTPPTMVTTSLTTPVTTSVTTSDQSAYDVYDAAAGNLSHEEARSPVDTQAGDNAGTSAGNVERQDQLEEPSDDHEESTAPAGMQHVPPPSTTAATPEVCQICERPLGRGLARRHPACAAFIRALNSWSVELAAASQPRPCEHCGMACRLCWGGHWVHAECQESWFFAQVGATPAGATPAGATPADATPADATPAGATPADATPAGAPPADATPADATPAGAPPADATPAGATPADATPADATPADTAPADRLVVAVADVSGIHLPDGTVRPLPEQIAHIGHLAEAVIALGLGRRYDKTWEVERGQLWLTPALVAKLGLPERLPRDSDTRGWKRLERLSWLSGARGEGWKIVNTNLRAWTSVWREGGSGAVIAVPHWLGRRSDKRFEIADVDPQTMARRAQLFADTVGIPYRHSPGNTGLRLLRWTRRGPGARRLLNPIDLPVPARGHPIQTDLAWHRPLTEEERARSYVISFDQNGSYVNAAQSLYVGLDVDPVHVTEDISFNGKVPGYWRVVVEQELPDLLPNMLDPTGRGRLQDGSYWVMTPTVEFLRKERKIDVRILEAYIWPEGSSARFYDDWAAHLREIIYAAKAVAKTSPDVDALLPTLKGLYTAGIGDLAAREALLRPGDVRPPDDRGDPLWRPDHRHLILARAQVGILRRLWAAGDSSGLWPVAIHTDAAYYVTDEPDPERLAAQLGLPKDDVKWGKFKFAGGGRVTADLAEGLGADHGWGAALDKVMVKPEAWLAMLAAGEV